MTHRPTFSVSSSHVVAALVAVLLTATQLGALDALAQQRSVSVHAQIVQLERVVVTGQRAATARPATLVAAACAPSSRVAC